jgi:hypothetical protein
MTKESYHGAEKTAEVCVIWPTNATQQMEKMVEQCCLTDSILVKDPRMAGPQGHGFVAEELHAETFNLDAILKNEDVRAYTDRYREWTMKGNDVCDIAEVVNGDIVNKSQVKFYNSGANSAKAQASNIQRAYHDYCRNAQKNNITPMSFEEYMRKHDIPNTIEGKIMSIYEGQTRIIPADQIKEAQETLRKMIAKESTSSKPNRMAVLKQYQETLDNISDRIKNGDIESKPLTYDEVKTIYKLSDDGKKVHKKIQNEYKTSSTIQQTVKAAGSAAAITTVIAGTLNTISYLDKVKKNEISIPDAIKGILTNTAIAAGDSALKAGAATIAASLTTRALPELFKGTALQSSFAVGTVAGASVCAVDVVECLVLVAAGKMTWAEMETRTGKNLFQTGAGVIGSSIGAAIGTPAGPIGMAIGGMIGGMITSVAMTYAIENHIEKPFRETMENSASLVQAESLMKDSLAYLSKAEELYADFVLGLAISEAQFAAGMEVISRKESENINLVNNLK